MPAILLDMDGTLYSSRRYGRALEKKIIDVLSRRLRVPRREAARRLSASRSVHRTLTRSVEALGLDRRKFYERLAESIDPSRYIEMNCDLARLITRLRGEGIPVGLHSNSGRPLALKVLAALGLSSRHFDVVVTSNEAEPKPSPEAYLYAARMLGSSPTDVIYVGDRIVEELKPAKQLGMRTVLVSRRRVKSSWVDLVIPDVRTLPKALQSQRLWRDFRPN